MVNNLANPQGNEDHWSKMAQDYTAFTAAASVKTSEALVSRANKALPFSAATSILDNGCGPGPVIIKVIADYGSQILDSASLRACDFSEGMVKVLDKTREANIAEGHEIWQRLQTGTADAHTLDGIEDGTMSHVIGGFLYMLLADPQKGLQASHRVLKTDGVIALSCWKGSQWMEIMQIINDVVPPEKALDLPAAWKSTEGVMKEMEVTGFRDVGAEYIDTAMPFESHDRMIEMFMTKMPPVVHALKDCSEEQKARLSKLMTERLWELCPEEPGRLTGTAIVAWGTK